ncbi:hypothetical protein O0L34_g16138 [Tuta absoluta]|nr:hypothetical protein O0L34_g16138 [Tuta absoluta]
MNSIQDSCVMSCDPTDARRHCDSGLHGGKLATGHLTVDHQTLSGKYATGQGTGKPSLRKHLRMGTWNVRGLLQPGKLEVVEKEMERCKIDILGLSEVHRRGSGHFTTSNGNMMYYGGAEDHSGNGVAFIIPKKLQNSVKGYLTPNERMIAIKLDASPVPINIIQVYAPTSLSAEEVSDQFYDDLNTLLNTIPSREVTIVLGDWNAKVGCTAGDPLNGTVVGNYGLGVRNDRGEKFLHFCVENQFTIMNTWFKNHPRRLYTWTSPNGHRNQIDFITIKSRWRSSVTNAKTLPGADCGSDHELVIADFRLRLKSTRPKLSKTVQLNKPALEHFHKTVDNKIKSLVWDPFDSSDADWNSLRKAILDTAKESRELYKTVSRKEEWISKESWALIEERKALKSEGLATDSQRDRYYQLHAEVQKSTRRDRDEHINNICNEIEGHADRAQTQDLFLKVKQLTGTFKPKSCIIDDSRGNTLTELETVLERWRNYCYELYRDEEGLNIERRWDNHMEEPQLLLSEVQDAIKKLKHKAVGPDGVTAAMLQHLGDEGTRILHQICNKIWKTGQWPDDWVQSAVVPLHKKGSTRKCENYRTLSLMSHASKILLCIINSRLAPFIDHQIPSEQSGFVAGKGTREQILNVRVLIEKCREFNIPLVLCFIDYAKAFDCVQWNTMLDVLIEMGVPEHLAFLIQNLYLDGTSFVKLENQNSKSFHTERGVRQGCILSPKLFNLYGEHIMRKALDGWDGGIAVGGHKITNLRYADDMTIVASSEIEMASLLKKIEMESALLGLKINHTKTKIMVVDRAQLLHQTDALDKYGKVSEFVYLGSLITSEGSCTEEIRRRSGMAKSAMANLDKVWRNRSIRRKTKVRLVRALVFSIFLYGAETWTIKSGDSSKINAFEMWCWRRLLRIPWTAMRTNESILKELNITKRLSTICQERTLGFFGHIMRSSRHDLERQIILGRVEGKRARGRAPTRWSDTVRNAAGGSMHRAVHTTYNRAEWRKLSCCRDPQH